MGFVRVVVLVAVIVSPIQAQERQVTGQVQVQVQGQPGNRQVQVEKTIQVQGPAAPAPRPIASYFEELIRFEVALLTEAELAHAAGYAMDLRQFTDPKFVAPASALLRTPWDDMVFKQLMIDSENKMDADQMVRTHFNQLRASTLFVFNMVRRGVGGKPLNDEMTKLTNAYYNMMSSIRFLVNWMSPNGFPVEDMIIYRNNIIRYANAVQASIVFIRNIRGLQVANFEYKDVGIGPIQTPPVATPAVATGPNVAATPVADPYPVYVPRVVEDPQTRQKGPSYLEGEVIAPDPKALK